MSIVGFPAQPKNLTKKLDEIEFASTPDLGKPYIDVNDPLDSAPPKNDLSRYRDGFVPSPAAKVCQEAAGLLDGERARQHGDKLALHRTMANLFTAYLGHPVMPREAAMLEVLMKAARTKHGLLNKDDYRDGSAYFGISWECADAGC